MTTVAPPPPAADLGGAKMSRADKIARAQDAFDEASHGFVAAGGECATLCKALASMQRSADQLCALTRDGDGSEKKRCTDAQKKLEVASAKVKSTCGGCGG